MHPFRTGLGNKYFRIAVIALVTFIIGWIIEDITPLELITGIVTERGLLAPEEVVSYLRELQTL